MKKDKKHALLILIFSILSVILLVIFMIRIIYAKNNYKDAINPFKKEQYTQEDLKKYQQKQENMKNLVENLFQNNGR